MGDWCVATGHTPQTYWALTREESNAVMSARNRDIERRNREAKRR